MESRCTHTVSMTDSDTRQAIALADLARTHGVRSLTVSDSGALHVILRNLDSRVITTTGRII